MEHVRTTVERRKSVLVSQQSTECNLRIFNELAIHHEPPMVHPDITVLAALGDERELNLPLARRSRRTRSRNVEVVRRVRHGQGVRHFAIRVHQQDNEVLVSARPLEVRILLGMPTFMVPKYLIHGG